MLVPTIFKSLLVELLACEGSMPLAMTREGQLSCRKRARNDALAWIGLKDGR